MKKIANFTQTYKPGVQTMKIENICSIIWLKIKRIYGLDQN